MSTLISPIPKILPKTEVECPPPYCWSQDEWGNIHQVTEQEAIVKILSSVITRMKNYFYPVGMIIGPLNTGRFDSERNFQIFEAAIEMTRRSGVGIFNQLHCRLALDEYVENFQKLCGMDLDPDYIFSEISIKVIKVAGFNRAFAIEGWEISPIAKLEFFHFEKQGLTPTIIPLKRILPHLN